MSGHQTFSDVIVKQGDSFSLITRTGFADISEWFINSSTALKTRYKITKIDD